MKFLKKIIPLFLITWLVFCIGYYFRNDLSLAWYNLNKKIYPCSKPITYSLGDFDERFGLSREALLQNLAQAEAVWEKPLNKNLFDSAGSGGLKINLIYDERQDTNIKLANLGLEINNDNATYESLKTKYDSLTSSYDLAKAELDVLIKNYEIQKSTYELAVKEANKKGDTSPREYAELEQARVALNNLAADLKDKQDQLVKLVDNINTVANATNRLIKNLNLNVNTYNTIGGESAGEFQAGEYVSGATGERINIYQFNDQTSLVSLIAHELGHALGLEHLANSDALMYRLEQNNNAEATPADLDVLNAICHRSLLSSFQSLIYGF